MAKFLVTGGAGFIGSNIAEHLVKSGHFVRVMDNFHTGKKENLEFSKGLGKGRFEFLKGDITNILHCQKACKGMDYVINHAALRSIPESMEHPQRYNQVNIDGLLNLLQASAKSKVKRLVHASSSAIYGETKPPQHEAKLPQPISPYALTKLAGEYYCRIFAESFGVETVCLRYFNVFGPKQALDDQYAVVIPKFIHCLLNDKPTPIFGTGKQTRDFVYIENVVSANVLAATTPGIKHGIYNVASGKEQSILDLVSALNRILGKNIKPKLLPVRSGDILKSSSDISKIQKELKYKPVVGFEKGLRNTVEYFRAKFSS